MVVSWPVVSTTRESSGKWCIKRPNNTTQRLEKHDVALLCAWISRSHILPLHPFLFYVSSLRAGVMQKQTPMCVCVCGVSLSGLMFLLIDFFPPPSLCVSLSRRWWVVDRHFPKEGGQLHRRHSSKRGILEVRGSFALDEFCRPPCSSLTRSVYSLCSSLYTLLLWIVFATSHFSCFSSSLSSQKSFSPLFVGMTPQCALREWKSTLLWLSLVAC